MKPPRRVPAWAVLPLVVAGLVALYVGPLGAPFLNDDYLFLEEARSRPLAESLRHLGALGNYYRPLSRQVYFEALAPIAGGHPLVFHLVDFAIFLGALALLADLLLALVPAAGAFAGTLAFALLPFQRVNLTWVSCSQDLIALAGALGAVALYRRGRTGAALLAAAAAFAGKEAALPLPAALLAWDLAIARAPAPRALSRVAPFAVLALAWTALALGMRAHNPAAAPLHFDPTHFAAGYAHMAQSLLGIEHPPGFLVALLSTGPPPLPLVLLVLAAFAAARAPEPPAPALAAPAPPQHAAGPTGSGAPPPVARVLAFACAWLAAFGFVTGPVAYSWSAYYYTLAAVGGAVAVGAAFRRAGPYALAALLAGLLWLHAGGAAVRAIAVADRPWVWTSHLTSFYFERAAALGDSISARLLRIEPTPPRGARLFFATLPPYAGFQMGNGARIRALYRDPSLESYFYSQFSESTAADRPCRFFYWNGVALDPLYRNAKDPLFQVGSDLLLLSRPDGAAHAFRRGLAAGEDPTDHWYWLGWTELWRGHRDAAESAWLRFGAHDDSLRWIAHLRAAHNAAVHGDTLGARRHLITAIRYGIGRPEAHAVLGEMLAREHPKYAALELMVATRLQPRDWIARRDLVVVLAGMTLEEPARRELAALARGDPRWRSDARVDSLARVLERRAPGAADVVEL